MPKVSRSVLVGFSAQQMFDLVNDVAKYPEFLPGCVGAKVLSQSATHMVAQVDVSKGAITHSFTTENELIEGQKITMNLVNGPFKHLTGVWVFHPMTEEACKIEFDLDFEFKNKMIAFAFGGIFKQLIESMVGAFTQRAKVIYVK